MWVIVVVDKMSVIVEMWFDDCSDVVEWLVLM